MKKAEIYYFRYQINKKLAEDEWIKYYNTENPVYIEYKKRYEKRSYNFLILWYKEIEKDLPKTKEKKIPIQLKLF